MVCSGSSNVTAINVDGSRASVKIGQSLAGSDAAAVALDVNYGDLATIGMPGQSHQGGGEVVTFGSANSDWSKGALHYLASDGVWYPTTGSAPSRGASQLLAISLGNTNPSQGMLLKGFFSTKSTSEDFPGYQSGSFTIGAPIYVATGSGEYIQDAAPDGSGAYVRIIGYGTATSDVIYFNPDGTWVENS